MKNENTRYIKSPTFSFEQVPNIIYNNITRVITISSIFDCYFSQRFNSSINRKKENFNPTRYNFLYYFKNIII